MYIFLSALFFFHTHDLIVLAQIRFLIIPDIYFIFCRLFFWFKISVPFSHVIYINIYIYVYILFFLSALNLEHFYFSKCV